MKPCEYLDKVISTASLLKEQSERFEEVIRILESVRKHKGRVYIVGNGGSAGTASHTACDFFKLGGLRAFSLCDNPSLITALTNDEGWSKVFTEQLDQVIEKGDVLIAFSVHGGSGSDKAGLWSQNLLGAIKLAKDSGAKTIGFSGFDGGEMLKMCDICIVVPANSTALVESFHVVIEHYIAFTMQLGDRE